ncbi:MAG: 50S ribosomal protein L3 [Nanoarchaeota archaeon]|nr:50S ribosomal protein L3 [Nanoarchaeota archaeon]|tara:strand:+ start:1941 stop:2897 length:957 start_codon:yes stop_codon:yes gene_type:complete
MSKPKSPRHGSMQFWPRKRAQRIYPRVRSWSEVDGTKLLGFAGYKAGMTHIKLRDNSNSTTKGQLISTAVTVIECPPLKPLSLRFYKKTNYGLKLTSEILAKNLDKELGRKIAMPKKLSEKPLPKEADEMRIVVYTQPKLIGKKKKPEIFEVALGSKDLEFGKKLLENEIKIQDVFKEGQLVDAHAVTKAKGFQGAVKRFGIKLRAKKSEKTRRAPGSLGPWNQQQHIMYRVAHAGQTGYHVRTEYNNLVLKISDNKDEINPKGGFLKYGEVKNDYILVKGSIPGPKKRLIRLTEPMRAKKKMEFAPEITSVSLKSKQ